MIAGKVMTPSNLLSLSRLILLIPIYFGRRPHRFSRRVSGAASEPDQRSGQSAGPPGG